MLWRLGSLRSTCNALLCSRLYSASNSAFSAALLPRCHSEIRRVMSPLGSTEWDYKPAHRPASAATPPALPPCAADTRTADPRPDSSPSAHKPAPRSEEHTSELQ